MKERRVSMTRLADASWLDVAYIWRLIRQEVDPLNPLAGETRGKQPRRDAVIRLGLALGLPLEQMDELLLAAGYAPLVR
jgi:hypothetical protein